VILTCTNAGTSVVTWTGFPAGLNPVTVSTSGVYDCLLTNPYGCMNITPILVEITNPISTVIQPELLCIDDLDNNDTLTVCANQLFDFFVYDEISNPSGAIVQCIPEMTITNFTIDSLSVGLIYENIIDCGNLICSFYSPVAGIYNLTVTAQIVRTNPCGSDTSYVTKTIYVEVFPAIIGSLNFTVTGPIEICPGGIAMIIASPPQNTYTWSNGTTNDTLLVTQPGIYTVIGSLIVTNSFGCNDQYHGTGTHTFNFYAQPNITLNPASGVICPNDSIELQCVGSSSIDWFGPSGYIGNGTNTIYASVPGNYYCIQDVDSGCVLISNTVTLSQNSSPSLQAFPPAICVSDSTTLSVLASPGSAIQWLPPLSGASPIQSVSNAGTYICDVTSCGVVSSLSITINNYPPLASPTITFMPPNLTSSFATGYQWFVNGFPLPMGSNQTYTPTVQGTYTVMVTDSNGCTALSDPFLVTSLQENDYENYIHFYPNPVSTFIQLLITDPQLKLKDARVIIRNVQGQILKNELLSNDFKIDVNHISNGIYFFELVSKNVNYKKKFIIRN